METKLNREDSLQIINEMIAEARKNFNVADVKTMIFMGWATALLALANIALLYILPQPYYSFFIWTLMLPISLFDIFLTSKRKKQALVYTHIDKIVSSVWRLFSFAVMLFLTSVFSLAYISGKWEVTMFITPMMLVLVGFAQGITGAAYKVSDYKIGGCVFWVGALVCVVLAATPYYMVGQFLILAICMILGFVLPAYRFTQKIKQNV